MRKLCAIAGLVAFIAPMAATAAPNSNKPDSQYAAPILMHVEWGRNRMQCHGNGLCITHPDPGPHCPPDAARPIAPSRNVDALAKVANDRMELQLITAPPERGDSVYVDDDIQLGRCSSALGFRSITILKGVYTLSHRGTKFGTLVIPVKTEPLGTGVPIR